jgi:hypothetical protein
MLMPNKCACCGHDQKDHFKEVGPCWAGESRNKTDCLCPKFVPMITEPSTEQLVKNWAADVVKTFPLLIDGEPIEMVAPADALFSRGCDLLGIKNPYKV